MQSINESSSSRLAMGLLGMTLLVALAGCGGPGQKAAGATATATPAVPTATLIPVPTSPPESKWTAVTNLNMVATIAPAQLHTQFEAFAGMTSKTSPPEIWVRRSDDYGVTYHDVSLPPIPGGATPSNVNILDGAQSPLNPSVYFLTAQTQTRCTGGPCQYQYVTMDGGATWQALNLPTPGILSVRAFNDAQTHVQRQRLFGVVANVILASSGVIPPGRLVVSGDGGATWALADSTIFAASQWIYNYAPVGDGSTIFALAGPTNTNQPPSWSPTLAIWRSDDAGATWTKEGPLPGAYALGFEAAFSSTGKPELYALVGDASGDFHLYASSDGGATWPATYDFHKGSDLSAPNAFPSLIGTYADGAVAIASYDYSTLAWDPTTGRPVTIFPAPPSGLSIRSEIFTPPNSLGVWYMWIAGQNGQGKPIYYYTGAQ